MATLASSEKRHRLRCLFCASGFLLLSCMSLPATSSTDQLSGHGCPGPSTPINMRKPVTVERVTDGDTLVLTDARRVRLIGLNTLELNSRGKRERQWAERAAQALQAALKGQSITLVAGRDKRDRHGRTLAHVLIDNGDNVAVSLVENGFGLAVAVGRNTQCADHMMRVERDARLQRRGIWREPGDWFIQANRLTGNERGFHLLESRVLRLSESTDSTVLVMENGLRVNLGRTWPGKSSSKRFVEKQLLGKRVELRGWLSAASGEVSLTLYHPANLRVLED